MGERSRLDPPMRALSKLSAMAVVGLLVACGGGGSEDSPPGPLPNHFDDMHIADVPLDQKPSVVTTQNDWAKAKMENAKAESERNKRSAVARERAESEKGRAATARDAWIKEQQGADAANGSPANWPDPMAAAQGQPQTTSSTSGGSSQ